MALLARGCDGRFAAVPQQDRSETGRRLIWSLNFYKQMNRAKGEVPVTHQLDYMRTLWMGSHGSPFQRTPHPGHLLDSQLVSSHLSTDSRAESRKAASQVKSTSIRLMGRSENFAASSRTGWVYSIYYTPEKKKSKSSIQQRWKWNWPHCVEAKGLQGFHNSMLGVRDLTRRTQTAPDYTVSPQRRRSHKCFTVTISSFLLQVGMASNLIAMAST